MGRNKERYSKEDKPGCILALLSNEGCQGFSVICWLGLNFSRFVNPKTMQRSQKPSGSSTEDPLGICFCSQNFSLLISKRKDGWSNLCSHPFSPYFRLSFDVSNFNPLICSSTSLFTHCLWIVLKILLSTFQSF